MEPDGGEPSVNRSEANDMAQAMSRAPAQSPARPAAREEAQQHPIKLYLVVWAWLFVLSLGSYLVDYFHLQGILRWTLICLFMTLKAGLIVAVFMHMAWERLTLVYAILVPPTLILLLLGIMAFQSEYVHWLQVHYFRIGP